MSTATSNFIVYNASAGSGKTYTLVRNYLMQILGSKDTGRYKQILAVTFTNKAVAEMKERILYSLHQFSAPTPAEDCKSMFTEIQQQLNVTAETLREKSKKVTHYLLHNYTAFNVQTIDKFTQSVVRTFAFDLNLNANFDVELDSKLILEQSVDLLLHTLGKDPAVTKVVLNFMKENIEDDTTWNIKNSLLEISKMILSETDLPHVKLLKDKTLQDFEKFKKGLLQKRRANEGEIKKEAERILQIFEAEGVIGNFNRSYIPKHFEKLLAEGTAEFKNDNTWKYNLDTYSFYTKKCPADIAAKIDSLVPEIIEKFNYTKKLVLENDYILRILKNITQTSLISSVFKVYEKFKKENNILLISDFNQLIFETIKDQPAPFIYERLGEKYKDFYIDEFQDTSEMQWRNLVPLADNAIASELPTGNGTGSLTIVGDAKQAIYRWRGGRAEQFIDLYHNENTPLFPSAIKTVENLTTNYRSYSNLITFHNAFFTYLATQFSDANYEQLYKDGNQQNTNAKQGGYVQFEFVEGRNAEEKNELYLQKTLETIQNLQKNNFLLQEICILVRKNSQGVLLANFLNDNNISVISSESLLLQNSNAVQLLINYAKYVLDTNHREAKLNFLKSLALHLEVTELAYFLESHIDKAPTQLWRTLEGYNIELQPNSLENTSIYDAIEQALRAFKLHQKADAYLQFFLDFVFDYSQKVNLGIVDFLEYWDSKKEKLSIVSPQGESAVQILSIHKSKGLEFPVVIYPFVDTNVYNTTKLNLWMPIKELSIKSTDNNSEVFTEAYISYNKKLFDQYSDISYQKSVEEQSLQELDNFNVLYVALTRAKEQLYVISGCRDAEKPSNGTFPYYFKEFVDNSSFEKLKEMVYGFGDIVRKSAPKEKNKSIPLDHFISTDKSEHRILPITSINEESVKSDAIAKGNLFHEVLSKIHDRSDLQKVMKQYKVTLENSEFAFLEEKIGQILNKSLFKGLYDGCNQVYNEREFVQNQKILIPDRVEIDRSNTVHIIDYKTGAPNTKYIEQLNYYAQLFKNNSIKQVKKYIVYISKDVFVEEIN